MSDEYNPPQDPLVILHEDAHVLGVEKPSGLLSVPGKGEHLADCLLSRVQAAFPHALLVHRLDRDTSGVMIFALTAHAQRHLGLSFEKRRAKKTYVARVWGHLEPKTGTVDLPLIGEFQTANALGAAAMAIATGVDPAAAFEALGKLDGVAGRLQAVGTKNSAPILLDYAHTPDGLDKLLRAARPHTQGQIILVFGAGGDRDSTKRAPMGEVAARLADQVIVTDDNPRTEDADAIRAEILKACPEATEIADREAAIRAGIERLEEGDVLLIAGKGHETGQILADRVIPFDETEIVTRILSEHGAGA